MAIFKIDDPNKGRKYIKSVDEANGTLEFQKGASGAYYRSDGIIADSTFQYLQFHFMEKYPELKYMTKESSW